MEYELRGKCKEFAEKYVTDNPDFRVACGFYYDPLMNSDEEHYWCVNKETGEIHDPTRKQFPSGGIPSFYREFNGFFSCEQCGKECHHESMIHSGRFHFCSVRCYGRCVGL